MTDRSQGPARDSEPPKAPSSAFQPEVPEENQEGPPTAAAGAPDTTTAQGGRHGRVKDDEDDGHS